ncbi:sperm-tail PG-rich repeat-containing protein 2 isoform X3 [Engystomops pustulosus]|uniref:sperm-tail PG-rich repeat-containing protein 2 isoform X3 n=1 Tax=Engystomops pustulosus TaxID=76066 RepID=UPI003AFAF06B
MYDRAPRSLVVTLGSTHENVGPGSYDLISDKLHKPAGYAPFLSTASREFTFNTPQTVSAAPGPGHYEIFSLKEKVKGGQTIQNKEKRFQESVSYVPGPGSYDLHVGSDVDGTKRMSPKPQKAETYATQKYRGVHFAKYSGKRTEFENHDGPGPGEYDVDQESALHYENVNSKKEDKKKYEPFIPRYHEVIVLQEEKKGVPGPGKYEIKRHFDVSTRLTKSADATHPPFLSHSKRFLPVKSITPAPGTYNEQRTALETLKKSSSMGQTPFGHTAVRFTPESRAQRTPGPGSYDVFSYGIAHESLKKAYQESSTKAAFGSYASRVLYISNKDAVWSPGPGHYLVKDKIEEPYKHKRTSVFSSGTERLSTNITAKDTPPPGSYNVSDSYENLHGKARYGPPRTFQAKRKQASFLSVAPRNFTLQNDFQVPAHRQDMNSCGRKSEKLNGPERPGAYDPMKKPVIQTPSSVPREERFKDPKEMTPGPGSYEMSPVFKDTVLKGTFNATLPNPLLSHVGVPQKNQIEKQLFSLSV